jgi:hypothetical protein
MLTGSITGTLAAYEQTEEGLLLAVVHEVSHFSVLVTDNTSYSSDLKERINLRETGMDIVVDCKFPAENFNGVYHAVKISIPDTPTQTTEPSTQPSQTAPPETESIEWEITILRYNEIYTNQYFVQREMVPPDLSNCEIDHLYYFYYTDDMVGGVQVICDEPVLAYQTDSHNLYFAKESEPTKLYCAPLTELTQHTVVYESDFGPINWIHTNWPLEDVLTLTEGNKRGVLLDLTTGEAEVFIEQYYIFDTTIEDMMIVDGMRTYNRIWFIGKLDENNQQKDYLYYIDTGKIIESYYN